MQTRWLILVTLRVLLDFMKLSSGFKFRDSFKSSQLFSHRMVSKNAKTFPESKKFEDGLLSGKRKPSSPPVAKPNIIYRKPSTLSPTPTSSSLSFSSQSTQSGSEHDSQSSSSDPWKILIEKLDKTKKSKSSVGKVENKSEDAQIDELKCPHFGVCSGCTINGNFQEASTVKLSRLFFKQIEQIQSLSSITSKSSPSNNNASFYNFHVSAITQWRTSVKLAVQASSRWGGLKIGNITVMIT
jgi:hypothetical protein